MNLWSIKFIPSKRRTFLQTSEQIFSIRTHAQGSVEPVVDGDAEAGEYGLAVEFVAFAFCDEGFRRVINPHRAGGRIDVPHQFDTSLEIVLQLASHLGFGVALADDFHGERRNPVGNDRVRIGVCGNLVLADERDVGKTNLIGKHSMRPIGSRDDAEVMIVEESTE